MRVLVTGANGFIGSHIVQHLVKRDIQVIATSRNINKSCGWLNSVHFIKCDLNKVPDDCFSYFQKPDILIHLSWESVRDVKKLSHIEDNLYANYFFLKQMIEQGLNNLLVAGTCFEYGMQSGSLSEKIEAQPNTPYSIAKDSLRKFLQQLQHAYNFDLKWLRLFYVYGSGQNPNTLIGQLDSALERGDSVFNMSGGEQLRDYLPIDKMVDYIVSIALQSNVKDVINCCSGQPVSIRKFIEDYLERKQAKIRLNLGYYPYPDYEPMSFWGDTEKMERAIA